MPTTYSKPDEETLDLIARARQRFHPVLDSIGVTLDVLMADNIDGDGESHQALKHHGYGAAAIVSIVSLKQRSLGAADALLLIDGCTWTSLDASSRLALIDHEFEHLTVPADGGGLCSWTPDKGLVGAPKLDDAGRPKLKLRLHDWQLGGFASVAARHGSAALEVQEVRKCKTEAGQYFWDFDPLEGVVIELDARKRRRAAAAAE